MEDIDMEEIDDYFRELRGERRSRASARTPGSGRRRKTPKTPASRGRSRSRATVARKLKLPSETKSMSLDRPARLYREAVKLTSAPKDERTKFDIYHLNKGKSLEEIDRMWKRRNAGKYKLKTRKVRHKNARSTLKKMPRGGKPYASRRQSTRKPKGAYRGASVMPRWARGETKHILMNDQCYSSAGNALAVRTDTLAPLATNGLVSNGVETSQSIGAIDTWCLNPILSNNTVTGRNGRSVDATYVRIQGHIRNDAVTNSVAEGVTAQKAYVRMLVLMVKGNNKDEDLATFSKDDLFRKIDNSVVGYAPPAPAGGTISAGTGAAAVRSLQLPVNKSRYTVLTDQKFQLASKGESFGSSDRLFDWKIPLKQKIKFNDAASCCSFRTNQLVFVMYSVDPECSDLTPEGDHLKLEFESKFSYKDL